MGRTCRKNLLWVLCLAWPLLAGASCDQGDERQEDPPPFECWYRTTSYGWLTAVDCPTLDCEPTGNGDEIRCSCNFYSQCDCDMEPDFSNPDDGMHNTFACHWVYETCYEGPPPQIIPPPNPCYCYGGYFCWMECEGRYSPDGRMVCMVDGEERKCQEAPDQDETGRVVVCRFGVAPTEWPLTQR